jgi:hypothetical protein
MDLIYLEQLTKDQINWIVVRKWCREGGIEIKYLLILIYIEV